MAKLNKANSTGSISVILRKDLINKLGWKVGDEVKIILDEESNRLYLEKKPENEF